MSRRSRAVRVGLDVLEGRCLLAHGPSTGVYATQPWLSAAVQRGYLGAESATPRPAAELVTTQVVGPTRPRVGQGLVIRIDVRNYGPDPATDVVLADLLPPSSQFVAAVTPAGTGGPPNAAGELLLPLGTIPPGQTASAFVVIRPTAMVLLQNAAGATSSVPNPAPFFALSLAQIPVLSPTTVTFQSPSVYAATRYGRGDVPTQFSLSFAAALDPASAQDIANYQVFQTVGDPNTGGEIDVPVPLRSATYRAGLKAVILRTAAHLPVGARVTIVVSLAPPTGVRTASGVPLNGDNGQPGGVAILTLNTVVAHGNFPRGFPAIPFLAAPTVLKHPLRNPAAV